MSTTEAQLQVCFVARQTKHVVPSTPIVVPAHLKRYGLSQIINHILSLEKPVPFDFLIDGVFLRGSLESQLREKNISMEDVVDIEYVESMLPPKPLATIAQDDWISSVLVIDNTKFLTGSYDGALRVWNSSKECEQTAKVHDGPVKCVSTVATSTSQDGSAVIYSGSQDQSAISWEFRDDKFVPVYKALGHTGSIDSISVNSQNTHFITASSDSTLKIWSSSVPSTSEVEVDSVPKSKKAKHASQVELITKAALSTCTGHVGGVTSTLFDRSDDKKAFSCGWDHSIRTWDMETCTNVSTKACDKVCLALDHSLHNGLLATGHADSVIRLWDSRDSGASMVKMSLTGHKGWVSSLQWSPSSKYILASASHDGTLNIWDIRSTSPVYSIKPEDSKDQSGETQRLLALTWAQNFIAIGGQSGKLGIYETNYS
ncbi:ribosome biogenesis protein ytm1 [Mycoemilia scoparia]|uniref:Ribosome biogenesis protein YTM1 n=1 Tax=Mycoemilia scoparia TaxID=417184 RepID=A0A9W8DSH8_9FUNG|nr:ribosome biogenesis protein ytm1 [Mycoemilia scoparia]